MTSRLAFRSAVTDALDTRAPDQHRVRSTEACICLRAGSDMASGTEPGNTLKFQETVYTFPDILRSPAMEPGRSTDSSLIHRLRLKITGSDTIPRQYGTCTSIRFAEGVPRRSFGGLIFSPFHICSCCCCHMLPDRSLRITFKMGCRRGCGHRSRHCSL